MYYNILFILSFFLLPSCVHSQSATIPIANIKISPEANYERQKGGKNPHKLIDGKTVSGGLFWLDANALGWQKHGEVVIDLEVSKVSSIGSIALNTAKNENANVYLPLNVNIFISRDGKSYAYAGDMARQDVDAAKGYQRVELSLNNIHQQAKYVRLVIVPRGSMFFTDEIRLFSSAGSHSQKKALTLSNDEMRTRIARNKQTAVHRLQLIEQLNQAPQQDQAAWKTLRDEILLEQNLSTGKQLELYQQKISRLNLLKDAGAKLLLHFSTASKTTNALQVKNAVNNIHYQRIEARNNYPEKRVFKLAVDRNAGTESTLYEVQHIRTRTSRSVPDVLVTVSSGQSMEFSPGERKTFLLAVRSLKPGNASINLGLGSEKLRLQVQSVDLGINESFRKQANLQVNVWPYYSTPFYQGREEAVRRDLLNHYVNIFTIPAWTLEPLNAATDHKKLKDYMRLYNPGDKVLLFLNHSSYMSNPGDYLKESWKKRYLAWHDRVMKILADKGIPPERIYLYPFDEVEFKEIEAFNTFSNWIRKVRPGSKIYLTVVEQQHLSKVQQQADIIQLLVTKNQIDQVKAKAGQQYWIYDIMDDSKMTDPDLRYRAMAWNAYRANATGIGFWNYADVFGASVWNDSDGPKSDYHAVYDRPGGVLPSMRWEAFKQGIEEYLLIKMHEKMFGRAATLKVIGTARISSAKQMDDLRIRLLERLTKK